MGIRQNLEIQIISKEDKIDYRYSILQFVADDELSACLPRLSNELHPQ